MGGKIKELAASGLRRGYGCSKPSEITIWRVVSTRFIAELGKIVPPWE
jgi:hypothetical protein